jgi:hypothetical protein
MGFMFDASDPKRWHYWTLFPEKAPLDFLGSFPRVVEEFVAGSGHAGAVFAIGRVLKRSVNTEQEQILGCSFDFHKWIGLAKTAIAFYDSQLVERRAAVHECTKVGVRLGVVKDVRRLIGKLIWEDDTMFSHLIPKPIVMTQTRRKPRKKH